VDPTKITVRKQIAFVAQDDSLQVTSTPRESIRFSAKLRLPRSTTDHQLDKLTQRMLDELGLAKCADTIVGGALIKGISGGERKRTSVGVELVVKPALVFLDEPVSFLFCERKEMTLILSAHHVFLDIWPGFLFGGATLSSFKEGGKRWC
jgi:ABC-type multidrug transport system ATPase subunit